MPAHHRHGGRHRRARRRACVAWSTRWWSPSTGSTSGRSSRARDGGRTRAGWRVPWPEVMRARLDGTTCVRLADAAGEHVHFEAPVPFRGNAEPLALPRPPRAPARRRQGRPPDPGLLRDRRRRTPPDRRGHRPRDRRPARQGRHRRPRQLRLPARRRPRRPDDRARLRLRPRLPQPAHAPGRRRARVVPDGARDARARLEGGADVRRGPQALPAAARRPRRARRRLRRASTSRAPSTRWAAAADSSPREALTPASTVVLEGVELAAPGRPGGACSSSSTARAGGSPTPRSSRSTRWPGCAASTDGCAACAPHVAAWNEIFRDRRSGDPAPGLVVRGVVADADAPRPPVVDLGSGSGRDSAWFARQGHRVVALDFSGAALSHTRAGCPRRASRARRARAAVQRPPQRPARRGELAREPEPPYLYARGLVGCLDAEARANLWRLCSMSLRRGGSLFLEYAAARPGLAARHLAAWSSASAPSSWCARSRPPGAGRPPRGRARRRLLRPARPPCRTARGPMGPTHSHPTHPRGERR